MDYFEINQEAIIRKKELMIIDFDGELVINDTEKGVHYGINNVGSMIWKILDEPQTINSIVGFLLTHYEIDKQRCQEEVSDFIRDLYVRELICIDI